MKNFKPTKLSEELWKNRAFLAESWFISLRDQICSSFLNLENEYNKKKQLKKMNFKRKKWVKDLSNPRNGGGTSCILKGNLFEKVGVNTSKVIGAFPKDFQKSIKGADENPNFFATGISVVAHMKSPLIPAAHFNTRFIITKDAWFGGGCDLTPTYKIKYVKNDFHKNLKYFCDNYNKKYYSKYSKMCEKYFYLPHRNEERGVGGIFFDYLQDDWEKNFSFVKGNGVFFLSYFSNLIKKFYQKDWTHSQRKKLLLKRSRYVEFNLLHDKGTMFGLKTGGNTDAILMSMPPIVTWD